MLHVIYVWKKLIKIIVVYTHFLKAYVTANQPTNGPRTAATAFFSTEFHCASQFNIYQREVSDNINCYNALIHNSN